MAAFDALMHLLHRRLTVLTAVGAAPEHEALGSEGRAWLDWKDSKDSPLRTPRIWMPYRSYLYGPRYPLLHFPCEHYQDLIRLGLLPGLAFVGWGYMFLGECLPSSKIVLCSILHRRNAGGRGWGWHSTRKQEDQGLKANLG